MKAIIALAVVVAINFGAWYVLNRPVAQRSWDGMIASVSFTPYQADQGPHEKKYPCREFHASGVRPDQVVQPAT